MLRGAACRLDFHRLRSVLSVGVGLMVAGGLSAQSPAPPVPTDSASLQTPSSSPSTDNSKPSDANVAEVTTHDTVPTFKVRVNEVLVRVVVRTEAGKVVPNLKREDFQLFDNRK